MEMKGVQAALSLQRIIDTIRARLSKWKLTIKLLNQSASEVQQQG